MGTQIQSCCAKREDKKEEKTDENGALETVKNPEAKQKQDVDEDKQDDEL